MYLVISVRSSYDLYSCIHFLRRSLDSLNSVITCHGKLANIPVLFKMSRPKSKITKDREKKI